MKVLVYGQVAKKENLEYIKTLLDVLDEERVKKVIYQPFAEDLGQFMPEAMDIESVKSNADLREHHPDFVISLGGDGTILKAITLIQDIEIPILGINLGRLGFLASTEKTRIREAIQQLKKGMFSIESRTMLHLESNFPLFGDTRFALNDFTLHKRDTSSMITIHTYVNGDFLNSYWADGIIVSTPTGSTGYSLSCGGPIIFPNSGNFVITPVAPHNLNVRPIVLSDTSVISFEIEGRSENFLCTLDSRFETITSKHQIAVRRCDFDSKIVMLDNMTFLKTIHEKLRWGNDSRN